MADLAIKPEIKVDDLDSKKIADLEDFEEDHSLQIPPNPGQSWLAKVPPEVWQKWHALYRDAAPGEQIKIGQIQVWDDQRHEAELHLNTELEATADVPQKYTIKIGTSGYNNAVVFGEKDLPGHQKQGFGRSRHLGPKSAGVNKYDRFNQPSEPYKKHNGYRSVIPKHTILAAKIASETSIIPIRDASYDAHLARSLTQAMQPKVSTTFQLGIQRDLQPGRQVGLFGSFTTTSKISSKNKKRAQREKFVRMSEPELLDALYACFRRYTHWPLKALRQELRQPEAFVKEVLEGIAVLIRSGDFAMTYTLKPQYKEALGEAALEPKGEVAKVESASSVDGSGEDGEEDDDDLGQMEDMNME